MNLALYQRTLVEGVRGPSPFVSICLDLSLFVSIWWTGLWDWTEGLDSHKVALTISKQHTHNYTTVYLHHMNWIQGRRPSLDINITGTRWSFSSHFLPVCMLYKYVYLYWRKPDKHWPLSNASIVNMHSCTLILSSKHSSVGKAHLYIYVSIVPRLRGDNQSGYENPYTVSRIITLPKSTWVAAQK